MSRGERTMFSEEWWNAAPFALALSLKTPSDYLVEYMADIAALLDDTKKAQSVRRGPLGINLEYRARAILHSLFSWRWSWLARNPVSAIETNPADVRGAEAFGSMLRYTQPQLMYEIWLCDALLILISAYLNSLNLQDRRTTSDFPAGGLWKPDELLDVEHLAIEICRSLEYQLENIFAPVPPHQWTMPLALAYVTLSPVNPIAVWVLSKIQAAPECRRMPWLCYIERLKGKDLDVADDLFACWPIKSRDPY